MKHFQTFRTPQSHYADGAGRLFPENTSKKGVREHVRMSKMFSVEN